MVYSRMPSIGAADAAASAPPRRRSISLFDPVLLLILLLGIYLRLQYIDSPMAEAHRWREVFNADVARNFYERSMNIFRPQVNWGGDMSPYVAMEFPLMHWIVAAFYWLVGEQAIVGRLVSLAFSIGTVWALYSLGTWLFGKAAGRAAAFFMAISPNAIFFGRFFISDTPMVFFSVAAILGWVIYLDTRSTAACVAGSTCAALAFLVKIPALMILAPIAWAAWESRRWAALKDRGLIIGSAVAVVVGGLWYWYADYIFHDTGLSEAIWHPSGTYPPPISLAAGPFITISHWATWSQLTDLNFYEEMMNRAWTIHLTPVGFILAMFSLFALWRRPRRRIVDAWLGVVVLFILMTTNGNFNHEFHQLPLIPPAALLAGLAAAPAFDGAWLRATAGPVLGMAGSAVTLLAVALISFQRSGVTQNFYRVGRLDMGPIAAGQAIERVVDPSALLVTVEYEEYGNNSAILLYWAHRRGWSFDFKSITPYVIELLRKDYAARYFVTTRWSALSEDRPEVAEYLRTKKEIQLPGSPRDTVLFDLTSPASN
jgi:4-amino-4-deoxy-L-arabinose transferase-like glycosyltransferase